MFVCVCVCGSGKLFHFCVWNNNAIVYLNNDIIIPGNHNQIRQAFVIAGIFRFQISILLWAVVMSNTNS